MHGYANLTEKAYAMGLNADFRLLGLQILGIASILGSSRPAREAT